MSVHPRVAVIGPGRAGTAVAAALAASGWPVVAVAGGSAAARAAFTGRIDGARDAGRDGLMSAVEGAELVVLAVPDDALAGVVRDVVVADGVTEAQGWVHLAGAHGREVLRPLALAGARTAAVHPAQTLGDPDRAARDLVGAAWAVTARAEDRAWAHRMVRAAGGTPHDVAEVDRPLYHLGLALASNATTAIVALAGDALRGAGISDPSAFLSPLATASAAAAATDGAGALTGPVRRGDAATVAAHRAELATALPEALDVWRSLVRLQVAMARRGGLDASVADAVVAAIEDP